MQKYQQAIDLAHQKQQVFYVLTNKSNQISIQQMLNTVLDRAAVLIGEIELLFIAFPSSYATFKGQKLKDLVSAQISDGLT